MALKTAPRAGYITEQVYIGEPSVWKARETDRIGHDSFRTASLALSTRTVCLCLPFPKEEVVDLVKGEAQAIFKELCAVETFCGGSQSSWNSRVWAVVYIFTNRMGSG